MTEVVPMTATRLQEELQRKERELRLIAEVSSLVGQTMPLRTILDRIAALVAAMLETPCCAILLLTLDGRQLTIEGAYGLESTYITQVNHHGLQHDDVADLPSREVCRTSRAMIWDDMIGDPRIAHLHEAQRRQGIRSMIAVPLHGPCGLIGTLNCYHAQPYHFDESDVSLLTTIGNHAAAAIHNARLIDRLNASVRRLSEMNEVIQQQHTMLARSEEIHHRLTSLVLEEHGLQAIVTTLAGLLNCGVCLYDRQLTLLTGAPPPHPTGQPAVVLQPDSYDRLLSNAGQQCATFRLPACPSVSTAAVVCPIVARNRTLGYLVVPDTATVAGELEQRAVEHAAIVCAVELLKQRVVQEIERRQRSSLLDDLLAGRLTDSHEIRHRAEMIGLRPGGCYHVLAVAPDNLAAYLAHRQLNEAQTTEQRQQLTDLFDHLVRRHIPQAIVVLPGEQLLVILPATAQTACSPTQLAGILQTAVPEALPGLSISIGLSGVAVPPEGLAGACREARQALAVIQSLDATGALLGYDQLGIYSLILHSEARAEILQLAHRWLDRLADYERRRGIGLIATIESFLSQGCNPRRVAAALFLHPNTVKHRLRLVAELTGADLDDTRQLLELQLALLVRRLRPELFAASG